MRSKLKRTKLLHRFNFSGDVIFLQECHSSESIERFWQCEYFRGKMFFSHGSPNSTGVITLISNSINFAVDRTLSDKNGRILILQGNIDGKKIVFANIYAPNLGSSTEHIEKYLDFMKELETLIEDAMSDESLLIVGGDFNLIMDKSVDAVGGNPTEYPECIEAWKNLSDHYNLIDIFRVRNGDKKLFTYAPMGNNPLNINRRLDYVLMPQEWEEWAQEERCLPLSITDHKLLKISLKMNNSQSEKGPSLWRHNDTHNTDPIFRDQLEENFPNWLREAKEDLDNPASVWEYLKFKIKTFSRRFAMDKSKANRTEQIKAEREVLTLSKNLQRHPGNSELRDKLYKAQGILDKLETQKVESVIFRSKVNWYEKGEKCSSYFFRQIRKNAGLSTVKRLIDNDKEYTDEKEVNEKIYTFYKILYEEDTEVTTRITKEKPDEFQREIFDHNDIPKLSKEQMENCDKSILPGEIHTVVFKHLHKGKSPGSDGLTVGFYQAFFHLLGMPLFNALKYSLERGELSPSQKQSVIKLIGKKDKDKRYIKNWRPISLMNVDAKILSKLLACRIKSVLHDIISPEQVAFVKGRYIGDGVRLIQSVIDSCEEENIPGYLLGLDMEKAFDKLNHEFIWKALGSFGFGENFINMVKTLYHKAESTVMNGGFSTKYFAIGRSARQGDPIAPFLFIISLHLLALYLLRNKNFKGLKLQNQLVKLSLFADDMTAFTPDEASIRFLFSTISKFSSISGLTINHSKTEGLILGNASKPTDFNIKWVSNIKITGVFFGKDSNEINKLNFDPIIQKIESKLSEWKNRDLSILGRVMITKTLAVSQLIFMMNMCVVPTYVLKKIQSMIYKFIHKGPDKITRSLACQSYDNGGIKSPDIIALVKASQAMWIKRFLYSEHHPWKYFLQAELDTIGGIDILRGKIHPKATIKVNSDFFRAVLLAWGEICDNPNPDELNEIDNLCLWSNQEIVTKKNKPFNDKILKENNINFVKDLFDEKGLPLSYEKLPNKKLWFRYLAILNGIPKTWRTAKRENGMHGGKQHYPASPTGAVGNRFRTLAEVQYAAEAETDIIPREMTIISRDQTIQISKAKQSTFYQIFVAHKEFIPSPGSNKLTHQLNITEEEWKSYRQIWFKTTISTKLRSFQWSIQHRLIYSNSTLANFGIIESPECSFCNEQYQTFDHLFLRCPVVENFWTRCNLLYSAVLGTEQLTDKDKLLGSIGNLEPEECITKNFLLVMMRKYIQVSNHKKDPITEIGFRHILQNYERIEREIAMQKDKNDLHYQKWEPLLPLINT